MPTDNTITISAASRIMQRIAGNLSTSRQEASGFADALNAAQAQDSLETYKASIEQRIGQIPFDATHASDHVSITISDEGYRAMQANPAYESWVLDTIKGVVSSHDAFSSVSGGNMIQMRFGATQKQCRIDPFRRNPDGMGELLGDKEKDYWEQREERAEENREISDKIAAAKAARRHANEIRKIRGKELLADTTGLTSDIMSLLLADFLG